MPAASDDEIRQFFERYFTTWNSHDKDGFLDAWHAVASDVCAEDPEGRLLRSGWEECVTAPWDLMNASVKMTPEAVLVRAHEAAIVIHVEVTIDEHAVVSRSTETFRFHEDGRVVIRTSWESPREQSDD